MLKKPFHVLILLVFMGTNAWGAEVEDLIGGYIDDRVVAAITNQIDNTFTGSLITYYPFFVENGTGLDAYLYGRDVITGANTFAKYLGRMPPDPIGGACSAIDESSLLTGARSLLQTSDSTVSGEPQYYALTIGFGDFCDNGEGGDGLISYRNFVFLYNFSNATLWKKTLFNRAVVGFGDNVLRIRDGNLIVDAHKTQIVAGREKAFHIVDRYDLSDGTLNSQRWMPKWDVPDD